MSLNANSQVITLEDHESYYPWGLQVYQKTLFYNLVHELNPIRDYFPVNAAPRIEFERVYWVKTTAEYSRKEVKDSGIERPKQLPVDIDVLFKDTIGGADRAAEEARLAAEDPVENRRGNASPARHNSYRAKENIYIANQILVKDGHRAQLKIYDDAYDEAYAINMQYLKGIARSNVYTFIIQTLGNYFYSSIGQVNCGDAAALLNEVDRFMATDPQGKKANLIVSFNSASFEKEGCNDIHKWIHFNVQTYNKLVALGETQTEETRMAIFKKTLPDAIFGQLLVSLYIIPNITWDILIEHVTTYSNVHSIKAMLTQKSSIHSMKSSHLNPSAGVFGVEGKEKERSVEACRRFS